MSNENQEKQNLVYLILFDKETGERRASYAVGVHADTMEELHKIVDDTPEYDGLLRIEDNGTIQNKTADGSHLYLNGEIVETPPYVPTVEEVQAAQIRALDVYSARCLGIGSGGVMNLNFCCLQCYLITLPEY